MRKLNNGLMVVADRVSQAWKVKQLDHQKAVPFGCSTN